MKRILLTGGAGALGRQFLRLCPEGWRLRVMSRRARPAKIPESIEWVEGDLASGRGLESAVEAVQAIVHTATDPRSPEAVDLQGTRRLLEKARHVEHFIYPSIVGIDKIPFRYYRQKLAVEELVRQSGIPWTILRATQFHSLLDFFLGAAARLPGLMFLPACFQFQPVDGKEMAALLARAVAGGPGGRLPDLAGPEVRRLEDLARVWLRARGLRKLLVPLPLPGAVARSFRRGDNTLPLVSGPGPTWEQWLALHGSPLRSVIQ
ncbi:MAG: NAD(P)H-binding protein [Candidatus Solibacter usitatus]|nr:NAD(P)H-binding protein [Candidatus Solibacter usitatus]